MSGQGSQSAHKVRPNVSPSQRQGPMKAVIAFTLNPTRRSPSSPTPWADVKSWQKRSPVPECRHSPDRRSPGSPCFKVERPKAVRLSPATSSLRRTGSLDTIGPYLKGQWPADLGGHHHAQPSGTFMLDKGTQTSPDDLPTESTRSIKTESKKKKKHRRSASFGHGDKLGLNSIRQRLQKTKDHGVKQRQSPIPANHQALSMTAPAVLIRSAAIGIPASTSAHIPKMSMSRYQRNSVEGLNPEIEKLVLMTISGPDEDLERPIDGHRAPVPSGTRSVDTQTPSGPQEDTHAGSPASPASRPQSISPGISIIPGPMDQSPRPSSVNDSSGSTPRDTECKSGNETGDGDSISPDGCTKSTASPKPNKIVREPPDGCEVVKVIDEDKAGRPPSIKEPLLFCPIQGQGQFVLKPSISSAFCPLSKIYTQGTSLSTQTSPRQSTILESQ